MAIVAFHTDLPYHRPHIDDSRSPGPIDLHSYLVHKPSSTFFVFAKGNAMEGVGIFSGDLLIIDRSLSPVHGHIVILVAQNEFFVRRLERFQGQLRFTSPSPHVPPIFASEYEYLEVWGVVTHSIRHHRIV